MWLQMENIDFGECLQEGVKTARLIDVRVDKSRIGENREVLPYIH